MLTTSHAFIHEFDPYDDMIEFLEASNEQVETAQARYKANVRQIELRAFFENASEDKDFMLEAEEKGLLSSVGNAVINLVKKIKEFITKMGEAIFGNTPLIKSDVEKVNQIVTQHPELRNQIVEGLEKEWFTYKDIAAYEKDITGLVMKLKQKQIDNQTFVDKMKAAAEKFKNSAAPILTVGATVVGLAKIIPSVNKTAKEGLDALKSWGENLSDLGAAAKGDDATSAAISEIHKATGEMTSEVNKAAKAQRGIRGCLSGIMSRYGNIKNARSGKDGGPKQSPNDPNQPNRPKNNGKGKK